jgi:hypothetical protein
MATWHQQKAGITPVPEKSGYVLVSDGPNVLRTSMSFGEHKDMAFNSLEGHKKNQPNLYHYLYYRGKLIA